MMHETFSFELFKERTKKIINQYTKKCGVLGDAFYDVTLSVNCLYGLLMIPEEQHRASLSTANAEDYLTNHGITSGMVQVEAWENDGVNPPQCPVSFQEMVIGLRNGLAHWGNGRKSREKKTNEPVKRKIDNSCNVCYCKGADGSVEALVIKGYYDDYKKFVSVTFHLNKNNDPANPIPAFIGLIQPV